MQLTYRRIEPLIFGVGLGLLYGFIGLLFYSILGALPRGMGFWGLELVYIGGGLLGGLLVSLLRPLGDSTWGRALLGVVALFPAYFLAALQVARGDSWAVKLLIGLIPAVLVGGAAGLALPRWNRAIEGNTDGWWQAPKE